MIDFSETLSTHSVYHDHPPCHTGAYCLLNLDTFSEFTQQLQLMSCYILTLANAIWF